MSSVCESSFPRVVLLFSGKRKSGKDYITDTLLNRLNPERCVVVKLSAPIKSFWANTHGLQFSKLLDSSEYKENHRQEMIQWGESMREKDYGYFCFAALKMFNAQEKPVWIVSDARRKTDLKWFYEHYGSRVKTVRVVADEVVRKQREWVFVSGVDDVASECDLDDVVQWDWVLHNNGKIEELENEIQSIVNWTLNCCQNS